MSKSLENTLLGPPDVLTVGARAPTPSSSKNQPPKAAPLKNKKLPSGKGKAPVKPQRKPAAADSKAPVIKSVKELSIAKRPKKDSRPVVKMGRKKLNAGEIKRRMDVKADFVRATRQLNGKKLTGKQLLIVLERSADHSDSLTMINKTFKTEPGIPTAEQVLAMEDLLKNQDLLLLEGRKTTKKPPVVPVTHVANDNVQSGDSDVEITRSVAATSCPKRKRQQNLREVGLFNALDKVTLGGLLHFLAGREVGLEEFYSYSAAEAEHHVDAFVRHCQTINIQVSPRDVSVYQMSIKKHHQGITRVQ